MKSNMFECKNVSTMTKKILLVLSVVLVLISCNKAGENEYIVTGTIKGIDNGKTVTLEVQDEKTGQLKAVDTVKIENGKFVFKGSAKEKISQEIFFFKIMFCNISAV